MAERWPEALERFRQEFERVAGVFHRVKTVAEVPAAVLAIAREKSAREVVAWDAAMLGLDLRPALAAAGLAVGTVAPGDNGEAARLRHRAEAARADLGITGVDFALAETGTMILLSGAGRPRSTSLLPATHVAVFDRRRLIESLEQVGIMLEALHVDPAAHDERGRHQLHHRAFAHRRHRADADARRSRTEGSARRVRGRAAGRGGAGMSDRLFTPDEVDELIPRLAEIVGRAMDHHHQATALQQHLHEEQERIRASGGGRIDQRDWKAKAERLDGLSIEVRAALEEIASLGGTTKDIETGLVDFPGRVGSETVNLCWKHGETAVRFWHRFDEGFAQRKPLP